MFQNSAPGPHQQFTQPWSSLRTSEQNKRPN